MGCQSAITTQIRAQGGDHMAGLKGNQGALRMNLFEQEASPTLYVLFRGIDREAR
jgi:hypothetical protein